MEIYKAVKGQFYITTDFNLLDLKMIHQYLSKDAYWSLNIPYSIVEKSVKNSLSFGVFHQKEQVGFGRVITDYATVAYLGDVFILPAYRGKGLAIFLMETIQNHPELTGLRRFVLATKDAHGLYEKFGWQSLKKPEIWMEKIKENPYEAK